MIYAVIDTNVIVSALLTHNPYTATAKVLDYMIGGKIRPIYSEDIIIEYKNVLYRAKFHFTESQIEPVMELIQKHGIHADRIPYDGTMPDEKDRPFYEVSLSYDDSFLVTGNIKHFPVTPKVVTPAQIIAILEKE